MSISYGDIEPFHVLPEFVCKAIPGEMLERSVDKADPKLRKKNGKVLKSTGKQANGKTKAKGDKSSKPKRGKRKGPSA